MVVFAVETVGVYGLTTNELDGTFFDGREVVRACSQDGGGRRWKGKWM